MIHQLHSKDHNTLPQSLANILLHVVFSTKNRAPYLDSPEVCGAMCGYLVGTLRHIDCPSLATNCVADHIHVLCQLSRTITVAKLVEEVKTSSSKWIKQEHRIGRTFTGRPATEHSR